MFHLRKTSRFVLLFNIKDGLWSYDGVTIKDRKNEWMKKRESKCIMVLNMHHCYIRFCWMNDRKRRKSPKYELCWHLPRFRVSVKLGWRRDAKVDLITLDVKSWCILWRRFMIRWLRMFIQMVYFIIIEFVSIYKSLYVVEICR